MTSALEPLKFSPGDQVQKVGGSYQAKGMVVAAFNTIASDITDLRLTQ